MRTTEEVELVNSPNKNAGKLNRNAEKDESNEVLKRIMEAENKVREAECFANQAAHELKTPLTILQGELELALRHDSQKNMQEVVAGALDEVIRLAFLVNEIMDLAKADTGNLPMKISSVDISALLADLTEDMSMIASEKGIAFDSTIIPDIMIMADNSRIKQALMNLMDNAIKYSKSGGQVTVTLKPGEETVVISIKDNGIGIAKKEIERIFDKHFRASNANSVHGGGLGLGLPLTERIIKACGGNITVFSKKGKGTEFKVELPLPG